MVEQEYTYQAVGSDGKLTTGHLPGIDARQVARSLQQQGLIPIRITPVVDSGQPEKVVPKGQTCRSLSLPGFQQLLAKLGLPGRRGVSGRELILFAEDLAILLRSGVSLTRSLVIVGELVEGKAFSQVISGVHQRVKEGSTLWQALEAYAGVFPPIMVNMVKAGESGGVLEQSLTSVADYLGGIQELKEYLVSALTYPLILLFTAGASILVLLTFVIPKFALIFTDMGVALPLATRLMLAAGTFLRSTWWLLAGLVVAAVIGWRSWCRTPAGRLRWDRLKLRLPVFGAIHHKTEISRFTRTMGTLLASGVPILESLQIVRGVVMNQVLYVFLDQLHGDLKRGDSMSRSLANGALFPSLAIHMIGVGEETGRLAEMLKKVADMYDRDLKVSIRKFTALFEPVVILVMGLVIGAMVVSMLLAIFSVNEMGL
ncbi:MAG: type II secretion system F family protein [Deltaproteobacteria bacterium]|nr:type II secretion system F family protein [Candidatus Anaeroferrophillus wilburensis]MBN2888370.1 type II secretion system F family protein [Deltaproteobacteria bacterium]